MTSAIGGVAVLEARDDKLAILLLEQMNVRGVIEA
jgi:hypothetical protein